MTRDRQRGNGRELQITGRRNNIEHGMARAREKIWESGFIGGRRRVIDPDRPMSNQTSMGSTPHLDQTDPRDKLSPPVVPDWDSWAEHAVHAASSAAPAAARVRTEAGGDAPVGVVAYDIMLTTQTCHHHVTVPQLRTVQCVNDVSVGGWRASP